MLASRTAFGRNREGIGLARGFDVDRDGHFLTQVIGQFGNAQADFNGAAQGVDGRADEGDFRGEMAIRIGIGGGLRLLPEAQEAEILFVDLHDQFSVAVRG